MIELITEHIEMPDITQRRFKKECIDWGGRQVKWMVVDTQTNTIRRKGCFEDIMVACHNLNKAYYRELNKLKSE